MKSEKLSSKDWASPKLGIITNSRPKIRDIVTAKCKLCEKNISIIFRELIRSTNRHIEMGLDGYHCVKCLRTTKEFRELCHNSSKRVVDKITAGASERSKALWQQPDYKKKMMIAMEGNKTQEFKDKVSDSIKKKFKDPEYISKIKQARKQYWSKDNYRSARTWSVEKFITEAIKKHGDKYDYKLVDYKTIKSEVTIICKKHGPFNQRPGHHIFYENGCPKCALEITTSNGQLEIIKWLQSNDYEVIINDREILDGLELDIWLPRQKFAVEYHGNYWHSYGSTETPSQKQKHSRKCDAAIAKNIQLFQVFENEWIHKQDIVKSMISHRLGDSKRIYARKCKCITLAGRIVDDFCKENHIAGPRTAKINIGLEYEENLVAIISFTDGEIIRLCSKIGLSVVGGLSKMLKYSGLQKISTYADRRYSTANGYLACGFKLIYTTKPGYYYIKNGKLYNRRKFQKHKLQQLLDNFDQNLTEHENMFNNGYRRIWDAGHYMLTR